MKKIFVPFLVSVLVLFSSCSGSLFDNLGEYTAALNTNVFIKNNLTESEKATILESLTVAIAPEVDGYLNMRERIVTTYDGIEVPVKLKYNKTHADRNIEILEVMPNKVRKDLSVIFNNSVKSASIKEYLKTPIDGESKVAIKSVADSIKYVVEQSLTQIDFPESEEWNSVVEAINEIIETFNTYVDEHSDKLTKGDILAISLLSSSINNVLSKIGAQAIVLGDSTLGVAFDVFKFEWRNIISKNSEKYFYTVIDSIAEELALMNAILPNCNSFLNFDIKEIAGSFLGGNS